MQIVCHGFRQTGQEQGSAGIGQDLGPTLRVLLGTITIGSMAGQAVKRGGKIHGIEGPRGGPLRQLGALLQELQHVRGRFCRHECLIQLAIASELPTLARVKTATAALANLVRWSSTATLLIVVASLIAVKSTVGVSSRVALLIHGRFSRRRLFPIRIV